MIDERKNEGLPLTEERKAILDYLLNQEMQRMANALADSHVPQAHAIAMTNRKRQCAEILEDLWS